MYILLEKANASGLDTVKNYDCIGYTTVESDVITWVSNNQEYRTYKYCSDKEIKV